MKTRKRCSAFLCLLLFNTLIPSTAIGQRTESPVVVTIGRPNIWSLEQAHYLLARMHHRNRELEAEPLQGLDPNVVNANQIKLVRQMLGISASLEQTKRPAGDSEDTQSATNNAAAIPALPTSEIKVPDKAFTDPKLNASTELDNFINLQYEIIARQLTLLRDEVGPDERLVFIELPHSIYTTDNRADKRLVQVWWKIEGISHMTRFPLLVEQIRGLEERLQTVRGFDAALESLSRQTTLSSQLDPSADSSSPRTTRIIDEKLFVYNGMEEAIVRERDRLVAIAEPSDDDKRNLDHMKESLTVINLIKQKLREVDRPATTQDELRNNRPRTTEQILIAAGEARRSAIQAGAVTGESRGVTFRKLEGLPAHRIRSIDLVPRQSSLILNKTYDSTSGLNLYGAVSWLFGLGIRGGYQRQKEQFEQYLHQEIYASAFGKGERDFGWTFAPTPGTKRLNPGLRTTYAVVIVPKDADTISLNAKGCFFKQGYNQPYSYTQTSSETWRDPNSSDRFCEDEKNFVLPIPNGGDRSGLYVESVRYHQNQKPGSRIAVSVKGQNFSPQVGVLVNGVPLRQSVGIAQPFLDKINSQDTTYKEQDGISGEVEYIDSDELVFAFKMPPDFKGTPTIHLVGPGRAVYLNRLPNVRVNGLLRTFEDAPKMFGTGDENFPDIQDLKIFPLTPPDRFTGLLIGENFAPNSHVFVNGRRADPFWIRRIGREQIRFQLPPVTGDEIIVTVLNPSGRNAGRSTISYRASLPLTLTQVTPLSYKADIMVVKIDGIGLRGLKIDRLGGADLPGSAVVQNGASQAYLKLFKPAEIVEVFLENGEGKTARTVIIRPEK